MSAGSNIQGAARGPFSVWIRQGPRLGHSEASGSGQLKMSLFMGALASLRQEAYLFPGAVKVCGTHRLSAIRFHSKSHPITGGIWMVLSNIPWPALLSFSPVFDGTISAHVRI